MTTATAVRQAITVAAPQERAFRMFTEGFDRWWPRTHKIGQAEMAEAVLEGRQGGRWYERDVDGSECDWGKVLVWDPPARLVLDWQLTGEWAYDADLHTEVEVTFVSEGPGRTRVELEHRGLDAYGGRAGEMRETFESPGGWPGILERFGQAAAAVAGASNSAPAASSAHRRAST
jgi:uncharacterized protein YndB with AHSA1/START domain